MKPTRASGAWAAAWLLAALAIRSVGAGDPSAADRQYRIARRLAAEGSSEAAAALRKVVELDPEGPLADDALLEEALLEGLPLWPEDLGRISPVAARRALSLLDRLLGRLPRADRAVEARFRQALLRLEPLQGRDVSAARVDLLGVATAADAADWAVLARYAGAWLGEQQGEDEKAKASYLRLVVDHPRSPAASRAQVGLARVLLREGGFGEASWWLQQTIEGAAPADTQAERLRELAVRSVLRKSGGKGWKNRDAPRSSPTGLREPVAMAPMGDGSVLLADRRTGSVIRHDPDARAPVAVWKLPDVQALAVDPMGRAFAAAGDRIVRLDGNGKVTPVAQAGSFAPVSAMAADGAGRLWVVDRRGERMGRVEPGGAAPTLVRESRGGRTTALVWDGRRLVVGEARPGRLVAIEPGGREVVLVEGLEKPVSLAVDPAGQVAVLDGRSDEVILYGPQGEIRDRLPGRVGGVGRPTAIGCGVDGSLDILDEASGLLVRLS